ncbi:HET-domain-containing protein [Hyaloscypha variabilis F]|uniref:HET-domain-containing protein n=1 Tax=Hyaloscypha variabilis (strain UAMH 11265 / GT02V1 / F) TaxID=1149755 RepID=A0A2J6QRQ4_HYAVF|nr:HET-domain-containing protein [Hyaloscypha variabilis F]
MAKNNADRVRYQHRPLKDHDSTRILHLQPGGFADDIHVRLTEIRLSEKPSFEALSYVWGSPTPTDPISCHGEELLVTSNCIAAMRQLRHKYRTRVLWIDAICIDQNSKNERNHQVRLMGEIYSTAKRVIIWLGEWTTESDFLMSFMKNYYRIWKYLPALRKILLLNHIKKLHTAETCAEFEDSLSDPGSFNPICDRPWFSRKWTIQEYVLSSEAFFQCGGKVLQASQLFSAFQDIMKRNYSYFNRDTYISSSFAAYTNVFNGLRQAIQHGDRVNEFSLFQILDLARQQIATEPRDAVFALYGILQRINPDITPPDYSKSVEQIYTEVAKMVIQSEKSLHILETMGEDSIGSNLPSWVPQFDIAPAHGFKQGIGREEMNPSATGINSRVTFNFSHYDKSLSVRGRIIDKIQRTAATHVSMYEEHENVLSQHTPDFINYPAVQQDGGDQSEAWLQCISTPTTLQLPPLFEQSPSDSSFTVDENISEQASIQAKIAEKRESEYLAILNRISSDRKLLNLHQAIYLQCEGTRLLITTDGRLGKGLKNIQEGDAVALIAGVDIPMILRKDGGSYRSMGPAYIHGIMNGEMWPENEDDLIDIVLS